MSETLSNVAEVAPLIRERAAEIEQGRQVPADVVGLLAEAGCLRMLVPAHHGGDALPLADALRVIEEISRADGSTGWLIGQIGLAHLLFACFPEQAQKEIYAGGPDVAGAGAVAPKGRAAADGDGWRVTGQWPFVTGCTHAEWVYLNCMVVEGRTPQVGPGGVPLTRMALFPAAELEILDTWDVVGLRGTASHDVRVSGAFCPGRRGFSLQGDTPGVRQAVFSIAQAGLLIAAVDLGIAQGALDEIAELAEGGRRRSFSRGSMASSPVFQDRLGEAWLTVRAARALLHEEAGAAWETATAGRVAEPLGRACLRATAAKVTDLAARAVRTAHELAGGAAVYQTSPLQRRLRDIHTATQHFVNGRDFYATVGALLVGEKVDPAGF
ncbi:acyl-CoA dehydrogenase family protein [Sphaerimonospora mesophila]|uniref:acyl-CoA dehydrogenase family protein n=1 Tax=Sphaerimonospora mesophila TaxID=37483 RepID=UPI0006E27772